MQKQYQFHVSMKLMNCDTHPQLQAFLHLAEFANENDKPDTLLIVYYAGHGYSSANDHNRIALSGTALWGKNDKVSRSIDWDDVERTLNATSSDVLVIFDCCNAGLLCRSAREGMTDPNRSFQYLGACESEQRTHGAGNQSFTSALTCALEKLASEPSFPVTKLVKVIEEHEAFPPKQRPVLFGGRYDPVCENIHLAPIGASNVDQHAASVYPESTPSSLGVMELRLYFANEVTEADIKSTAQTLKKRMNQEGLRCHAISFLDKYSLEPVAIATRAALRWKEIVSNRTSHRTAATNIEPPQTSQVIPDLGVGFSLWLRSCLNMQALVKHQPAPHNASAAEQRGMVETVVVAAPPIFLAFYLFHWYSSVRVG